MFYYLFTKLFYYLTTKLVYNFKMLPKKIPMYVFFFVWPLYYICGMYEYDSLNDNCLEENKQAISNEYTEFSEAKTLKESACEFSDVIHAVIKYLGYLWKISKI